MAFEAAQQRDGDRQFLVFRVAGLEQVQYRIDPQRRAGLEITIEEAGQQLPVEQAQCIRFAGRGERGGQGLAQHGAPALVADEVVGVVVPFEHAGRAQLRTLYVATRGEALRRLFVVAHRSRVFAQETQARQAIAQSWFGVLQRCGQTPHPGRQLIEVAQRELGLEEGQQQLGRGFDVVGIEQQVQRRVALALIQKSLRGLTQQAAALRRVELAPTSIEQVLAQQRMQPIYPTRMLDAFCEQVVRAQLFEPLLRVGDP